jgi:hypothetical protein
MGAEGVQLFSFYAFVIGRIAVSPARCLIRCALYLQGSNDGEEWTVIKAHKNDTALGTDKYSLAAWPVDCKRAYRCVS